MKYSVAVVILFFALIFFADCAQIGTLSGGDKDTIPPRVLESKPQFKAVNVEGDKVEFTFDEFIVLDNMRQNFYSSPPLGSYPDFQIRGKRLIIKFNEPIKDSVTYFMNFGSGVKDFTEGNKLNNFSFVFATGEHIDSMKISGRLFRAESTEPEVKVPVMLYKNLRDSVPALERPYYYTLTDSAGNFFFNYLKPGTYKIFSLQDNDNNMLFNLPDERIAFGDTFLTTTVTATEKTDTLFAGTVLAEGDTLQNDSIIKDISYTYKPDDILMFSFKEERKRQYIRDFKRPLPGMLTLNFNIPVKNVKFHFPYRDISKQDTLMQFSDSMTMQTVWIKQWETAQSDSIFAHIDYPLIDSVGQEYIFTDSLLFLKSTTVKDSSIFEIFELETTEKIGYYESFPFYSQVPIEKWDSSKIKLVQLIDTAVADQKIQTIDLSQRPEHDLLTLKFNRPTKHFSLRENGELIDINMHQNTSKDSIWCYLPEEFALKDSLLLDVFYDNQYFFSQTQNLSDQLLFTYTEQTISETVRKQKHILHLHFVKPVKHAIEIFELPNETPIEFDILKADNDKYFTLELTQNSVIEKDTLMLQIKTLDGHLPSGESIEFVEDKISIYTPEKQYIKEAKRALEQGFYLLFNRTISPDDVEVREKNIGIIYPLVAENDSLYFDNRLWRNVDTISIKVNYLNERNTLKEDSFNIIREQRKQPPRRTQAQADKGTEPGLHKITIEKEVPFSLKQDSTNYLKKMLLTEINPEYKYKTVLDSGAFTDLFGRQSRRKESTYEILKKDDYGRLTIDIINIGNIERDDFYHITEDDTLTLPELGNGQLILYLYNQENKLVQDYFIRTDTTLVFNRLLPQNYYIKAIYDSNNNRRWDTGNYFENKQPERVIFFPKDIPVKAGWELVYDWNIIFTRKK